MSDSTTPDKTPPEQPEPRARMFIEVEFRDRAGCTQVHVMDEHQAARLAVEMCTLLNWMVVDENGSPQ